MCGICGMVRPAGIGESGRAEMRRVRDALAARGPDGEGEWLSPDDTVALGHRRLAILDLSPAGAQPMTSADGRLTIVFNGEIYNYRELRAELEGAGAGFRSSGDTEVVLELWRRKGRATLACLRGMYAFAIWDQSARQLYLARDPYGIKPLYYAQDGATLRFASQVKALAAGGGVSEDLDLAAIAGFLSWGSVPEPLTTFRGIRALPAGHLARFDIEDRWHLAPAPQLRVDPSRTNAESAVLESVGAHLVSDVPVALFLSAGLDSALVAAAARRQAKAAPVALTLTWDEASGTERDEVPVARRVAEILGLRHVVRRISGTEVRESLPDILDAMDQPSIDGFNTWLIARVARQEGFKVALSGIGGDELLGGYSSFREIPVWHRRVRRLESLPFVDRFWRKLVASRAHDRPKLPEVFRYARTWAGAYVLRRALFLPHEVDDLIGPDGRSGGPLYDAVLDAWLALDTSSLGASPGLLADPWRVVQRLESSIYLRQQLLRDADWAGMAHGVEIRTPLVDRQLLASLESVNFEPARGRGKGDFVRRAAPELPQELFTRAKSGFQMPIEEWLAGDDETTLKSQGTRSRSLSLRVLAASGFELKDLRAA